MTEETQLIWDKMGQFPTGASLDEIIIWSGRKPEQVRVTVGLMIQAGQLRAAGKDFLGKRLYVRGRLNTFGLADWQ